MALGSLPIFAKYYYEPGPNTGKPTIAYPHITAPYLTNIESKTPINIFLCIIF